MLQPNTNRGMKISSVIDNAAKPSADTMRIEFLSGASAFIGKIQKRQIVKDFF